MKELFISMLALLLLGACQPSAEKPKYSEIQAPYVPKKYIEFSFASEAKTPDEHLAEHQADKKACEQAFKLIEHDSDLHEGFLKFDRSTKHFSDFLSESQYAKTAPVAYLISAKSRFELDVDFHNPHQYRIGEIYCDVKLIARMNAIESLGSTPQSWEIREELLTSLFSELGYEDEHHAYKFQLKDIYKHAEDASKRYNGVLKHEFLLWLDSLVSG